MSRASFRFYGELNDLVASPLRGVSFEHVFSGTPAVKDVIESLGVPHTEVDLIIADGAPVDFGWRVHDAARVAVYPRFSGIDVAPVTRTRAAAPAELRFVADGHLGRLARYLRIAGFDTEWRRDADDAELARASASEGRILLTRDRGLLKRREVTHGLLVRSGDAAVQLREVAARFDLARAARPFSRCTACNGALAPVAKELVAARVPPRVLERHDAFWACPRCARVYWAGSHTRRMELLLRVLQARTVRSASDAPPDATAR